MTTTDRELLERAAKAAGIDGQYECWAGQGFMEGIRRTGSPKEFKIWNPLMYDDQALRLAGTLSMSVEICEHETSTYAYAGPVPRVYAMELWRDDKDAATRRAIVIAAAMAWEGE